MTKNNTLNITIEESLQTAPLGKKSNYINQYDPSLLFPIPRQGKRDEIGVPAVLPFQGYDVWNGFELSWLNNKGKPVVAIAEFTFPCTSPNIIESKSFKLYLNSFNNSKYSSAAEVQKRLTADLTQSAGQPVKVTVFEGKDFSPAALEDFDGISLDDLDCECTKYLVDPSYLSTKGDQIIEETLRSNLLKSNCLVTGQPDWGSIKIQYTGRPIDHENLLKYIVSFRDHNEFHEQCVERVFMDIMRHCKPQKLTVEARYTRRGGLDINPFRTTERNSSPKNIRMHRQ